MSVHYRCLYGAAIIQHGAIQTRKISKNFKIHWPIFTSWEDKILTFHWVVLMIFLSEPIWISKAYKNCYIAIWSIRFNFVWLWLSVTLRGLKYFVNVSYRCTNHWFTKWLKLKGDCHGIFVVCRSTVCGNPYLASLQKNATGAPNEKILLLVSERRFYVTSVLCASYRLISR